MLADQDIYTDLLFQQTEEEEEEAEASKKEIENATKEKGLLSVSPKIY